MKELGNVFILGDSYSTFRGYIPEEYPAYYGQTVHEATDIRTVDQTWWYQLLEETDSKLAGNCSWSGSVICNTGYNERYCPQDSFIGRFNKFVDDGFFENNKIDTFFLFGGTNDSWANSPLGKIKWADWSEEDLKNALPAIVYMVDIITKKVSNAKLYCILNDELKPEIADCFRQVCHKYNAQCIELEGIDKMSGHPSIKGMKQIKDQVYSLV